MGSGWIIVEVMTTKAKRHSAYNRLLLGMSIVDVMSSIAYMFGTAPMTPGEGEMAWASGTITTCTVQGFFIQLGLSAQLYHVCLSVYYLLIVKFEVTADRIEKYFEPIMHITVLFFGLSTGFASIALELINNAALWCWIAPKPFGCHPKWFMDTKDPCTRGEKAHIYRIVFWYFPLWSSLTVVFVLNIWIYLTVRRRERKADKLKYVHDQKYGKRHYDKTSVVIPTRSISKIDSHLRFMFGQHPSSIFTSVDIAGKDKNSKEHSRSIVSASRVKSPASASDFRSSASSSDVRSPDFRSPDFRSSDSLSPIHENITSSVQFLPRNENPDKRKEPNNHSLQTEMDNMNEKTTSNQKKKEILTSVRVSNKRSEHSSSSFSSQILSLPIFNILKSDNVSENYDENQVSRDDKNNLWNDENQNLRDDEDNLFRSSLHSIKKMILPEKMAMRLSRHVQMQNSQELQSNNSLAIADAKYVLATIEDCPSAAMQHAATYQIGTRVVLYQSIAYVLGFWMIWIFPTINWLLQYSNHGNMFWLLFLQALFEPLHGLFNILVYRFAHYLRLKQRHPRWSTRQLLRHTMRWTFQSRKHKVWKGEDRNRKSEIKQIEIENSNRLCRESNFAKSRINLESDSEESGILNDMPEVSDELDENSKVIRRMSSMMGDLMTEYADDPVALNQGFVEVIGEDLFSYPLPSTSESAFPTVYARQSFSEIPSSHPIVVPTSQFPAPVSSTEHLHSPSNEYNHYEATSRSIGYDTQIRNSQNDTMEDVTEIKTSAILTEDDDQDLDSNIEETEKDESNGSDSGMDTQEQVPGNKGVEPEVVDPSNENEHEEENITRTQKSIESDD